MRNPKVWVISDTHFGHALMAHTRGFNGDIDAHDRALVEAWNSTIHDDDTVWHLGDVYFREGYKVLYALRGRVRVVLGNHDAASSHIERIMSAGWGVCGVAVVGKNVLTHIPVHEAQLRRFSLNIHGHTHASRVMDGGHMFKEDRRYVPVSVEHLPDWKPILLQTAIQQGVPDSV